MGRCACKKCHNEWRANQRAYNHAGQYMHAFHCAQDARIFDEDGDVDSGDAIEAAVACDECRYRHCEALMTRKPLGHPRIIRRFDPNSDSQQTDGDTQADGEKGDENGG